MKKKKLKFYITNLLRNLTKAKVTCSGIVLNSGDGEELVSPITIGNAACEITRFPWKLENPLNPFVIYGGKVNLLNWSAKQFSQTHNPYKQSMSFANPSLTSWLVAHTYKHNNLWTWEREGKREKKKHVCHTVTMEHLYNQSEYHSHIN